MSASEKHLELIQSVITRLAGNSYAYKGWAITVAAALVAFLAEREPTLVIVAVYPIAAFWFLDGHSLAMERAFRKLYDKACDGAVKPYTMSLKGIRRPFVDQMDAILSGTLLIFYGSALVFILLIARSV